MNRPRLLFYIQHLLGIGHLVRGARIAAAAADRFDVTVVLGGERPAGIDFGPAAIVELPALKAGPAGFSTLVDGEGRPLDDALRARRCGRLLRAFDETAPDVVLIEAFPFGRRAMRFELDPLIDTARRRQARPLIACSVRDILQEHKDPARSIETVDTVRRVFDRVLVHGDPRLARLEESFPAAAAIADRLSYTGIVGPPARGAAPVGDTFDVIVSVGGGAVGTDLIAAALAARPLTRLARASWLVLTGPNLPAGAAVASGPGVTIRPFAPDLPARLRQARLSISQAGYNTVADLLAAPACRAVLIPYVGAGETEQSRRAALLQAAGRGIAIEAHGLTAGRLAAAIDRALDGPPRMLDVDCNGAERTADLLDNALRALDRPDRRGTLRAG